MAGTAATKKRFIVTRAGTRARVGMATLVVVALISFDASDRMRSEPTWSDQVAAGRAACETGRDDVDLRIAPVRFADEWFVRTPCARLE